MHLRPLPLFVSIALHLPVSSVIAQESAEDLELVHVVGSRNAGRSSADLPVAIDTIEAEKLIATGELELGRMLQRTVPSFNFSSSSISDGTDALRPATLRGLGPDQTLVLINGKRRHAGALLHINSSVGRGTAGVDINAIPSSSIKRIEVLRDGAAAQYGSDAIAGVINIVLRDETPTTFSSRIGEYKEGDGFTQLYALNHTFYSETGFLNGTLEFRDRESTNRAGLSGSCQYLLGCVDTDNNGIPNALDPRESSFDRQNFRIGDADSNQISMILNGAWETLDGEWFAFATVSNRNNESAGFYRRANETQRNPTLPDGEAFFPDGYLPLIETELKDYSFNIGYASELENEVSYEASVTWGQNRMHYDVANSINASFINAAIANNESAAEIRATSPTSAHAGELVLDLATFNLDFVKESLSQNLAYGVELRLDRYQIRAGDVYSYADFDAALTVGTSGIQVFPGFTPQNATDENRWVVSGYLDSEWEINDKSMLTAALRADHYDGFGSTLNFKLASRYDLNSEISARASLSTGFRAPSMQQLYFNNISTQFNNGIATQVGTFRNDSQLAKDIGIPGLTEEKSVNLSAGIVYTGEESSITLDFYYIDINDRIVLSEQLSAGLGSETLDSALSGAGIDRAQFFVNAANTETKGLDLVATFHPLGKEVGLDVIFAANYSDTDVSDIFAPGGLSGVSPSDIFGEQAVSIVEKWQPKSHINTSVFYSIDDWTYTLMLSRFGEYTITDANQTQTYGAKLLTDLGVNYQLNEHAKLSLGINNLFDVKPDRNEIGQSRSGQLETEAGQLIVDSAGVFDYSRRAAPFGFNGAFYYMSLNYTF